MVLSADALTHAGSVALSTGWHSPDSNENTYKINGYISPGNQLSGEKVLALFLVAAYALRMRATALTRISFHGSNGSQMWMAQ